MLTVKLTTDIEGLGRAGDLVVADRTQQPRDGEWCVVERGTTGASCVRWEPGLPRGARVVCPHPSRSATPFAG